MKALEGRVWPQILVSHRHVLWVFVNLPSMGHDGRLVQFGWLPSQAGEDDTQHHDQVRDARARFVEDSITKSQGGWRQEVLRDVTLTHTNGVSRSHPWGSLTTRRKKPNDETIKKAASTEGR